METIYNAKNFRMPRWNQLPSISLYLDQVVQLIEDWIGEYVEVGASKLTRTMVNNYVKQKIVRAPEKRKYDRRSVATLIVISVVKPAFPIGDISKLVKQALITGDAESSYDDFCEVMEQEIDSAFQQEIIESMPIERSDSDLFVNVARACAAQFYVRSMYLCKMDEKIKEHKEKQDDGNK